MVSCVSIVVLVIGPGASTRWARSMDLKADGQLQFIRADRAEAAA
jgi:hypothetical protein